MLQKAIKATAFDIVLHSISSKLYICLSFACSASSGYLLHAASACKALHSAHQWQGVMTDMCTAPNQSRLLPAIFGQDMTLTFLDKSPRQTDFFNLNIGHACDDSCQA